MQKFEVSQGVYIKPQKVWRRGVVVAVYEKPVAVRVRLEDRNSKDEWIVKHDEIYTHSEFEAKNLADKLAEKNSLPTTNHTVSHHEIPG